MFEYMNMKAVVVDSINKLNVINASLSGEYSCSDKRKSDSAYMHAYYIMSVDNTDERTRLLDTTHNSDCLFPSPQALEMIEILEKQLSQEHQLRKTADSYLLKLQTARQHTVGCMDSVKDVQHSINKHCKAVR